MTYRYNQKLQTRKMNVKKLIAGTVASFALITGVAVPALASSAGDGSSYGTQPGFTTSNANTPCAGHGSFGAFGKDFNFGNDTSGHTPYPGNDQNGNGANGQATAANNSTLCGNPQNQ